MPRRVLTGYLAVQAVLGAAVFGAPAAAAVWWGAIGVVSVAAVGWGIHRHRPPRRLPWLLLAGGAGALAVGDVHYELSRRTAGAAGDVLSLIADVAYLATFGLLAAGVLGLTRTTVALRDRSALLDTLVLVVVTGLVTWTLVVGPAVTDVDLPAVEKALLAVHGLGGVLVVVVMLRLAAAAWRDPTVIGLAVGAAGMLAADIWYAAAELNAGWQPGHPAELGWYVFYVSWGVAALHPNMARLATPSAPGPDDIAAMRVGLLTITCLTVPFLLVIQAFAGEPAELPDGLVTAAAAGLTTLLAVTRVVDSVTGHRAAVHRERSLRRAGMRLLSATTTAQVAETVRRSVGELLPAGTGHQILFAVRRPVAGADGEPPDPDSVADWQPQVVVDDPLPVDAARRRTRIMPTRLLHPDLADRLAPAPAALVAALAGPDGHQGGRAAPAPSAGTGTALLVGAADGALAASRDAIEVVVAQSALALHRIAATEDAARRDRDRYLNLVAGTAGDAVVIVGADDRIRYASPPCSRLFGVEPAVLADWRDLVHPADQAQVSRTLGAAGDRDDGSAVGDQWVLRRPDGSHVLLEVRCRDLRRVPGVRGLVLTFSDLADQRRRDSELALRRIDRSAPGQNRRSLRRRFR
ncbi:PAS domain S-box-containing protein [Micromonospora sp. Llam0]|uniref:PAS domain-containing protein n=1 Tax=Micromonospora sp. Llam0 TaxID=2485143 RepID=UPI000F49459F|nr:PAS domain-containing protein [Micromonospora sp. Llam0]ROO51213.1 PAS domain S-box-containing protein [Micromonospora sp. Llam0]